MNSSLPIRLNNIRAVDTDGTVTRHLRMRHLALQNVTLSQPWLLEALGVLNGYCNGDNLSVYVYTYKTTTRPVVERDRWHQLRRPVPAPLQDWSCDWCSIRVWLLDPHSNLCVHELCNALWQVFRWRTMRVLRVGLLDCPCRFVLTSGNGTYPKTWGCWLINPSWSTRNF